MPLAYAAIGLGILFLISGLKGQSLADVLNGRDGGGTLDPAGGQGETISFFSDPAGGSSTGGGGGGPVSGTQSGSPIAGQPPRASTHPTAGLPGFPAYDYMAKAGTPVVSPTDGKVLRVSGSDPQNGPPNGPHGPFGLSVYIVGGGKTYYLTHLGSLSVKAGDSVRQGQRIGTVGNYAKWGGADHVHQGVNG